MELGGTFTLTFPHCFNPEQVRPPVAASPATVLPATAVTAATVLPATALAVATTVTAAADVTLIERAATVSCT